MKELSRLVTERQDEFSSLKLMIVYRNTEKLLAGAIGADAEGVTVVYYHHSVAYKYRGKLRARNILYSVYPYMSISPDELPLKKLSSLEELKDFTESTDKALILFEFCGWTRNLLAKGKNNGTANGINLEGYPLMTLFILTSIFWSFVFNLLVTETIVKAFCILRNVWSVVFKTVFL